MSKNIQYVQKYNKWPKNIATSSIARPSKIYPNWDIWFGNMPSGISVICMNQAILRPASIIRRRIAQLFESLTLPGLPDVPFYNVPKRKNTPRDHKIY
jgi:hypothetical protein